MIRLITDLILLAILAFLGLAFTAIALLSNSHTTDTQSVVWYS